MGRPLLIDVPPVDTKSPANLNLVSQPVSRDWGISKWPSLSPIMQVHAKRLWVTGTVQTIDQVVTSLVAIDRHIDTADISAFMDANTDSPEWTSERENFLQHSYARELEDAKRVQLEAIDDFYDKRIFHPLRNCIMKSVQTLSDSDEVQSADIARLVGATDKLYDMQRRARGIEANQAALPPKDADIKNREMFLKEVEEATVTVLQVKEKEIEQLSLDPV